MIKRLLNIFIKNSIKIITLLFAVSGISFLLLNASPINPINQYILNLGTTISPAQRIEIENYWGINKTPLDRYVSWLNELLHGNFGISTIYRREVIDVIKERFINSFALMLCAWLLAGIIGFFLGCLMGIKRDKWQDKLIKKICYILSCIPTFWIGLLFLLIFGVWLKWFPIGFSSPIGVLSKDVSLGQRIYHLILPALTLSLTSFSSIALHTREKLVDVLNSEYVLFAKTKGESEYTILFKHGIRNTIIPSLSLQFSSFAETFSGSIMIENVFSYPGLGSALSSAGLQGDLSLLLGITLFSTLFVYVGNMIANLLYGIIDPSIKGVKS